MLGMNQFEMGLVGIILFVISVAIAVYLIRDYGKESGEKKVGKPTDNQTVGQRDRQISINIGINSSDFTDDKMSTNRMNDFHKFVESISSGSNSHDKQPSKEGTSKKTNK